MRRHIQRWLAAIGYWLVRRCATKGFVVIYDHAGHSGDAAEQYYGFFSDPADARKMYAALIGRGADQYSEAKLCAVIEDI